MEGHFGQHNIYSTLNKYFLLQTKLQESQQACVSRLKLHSIARFCANNVEQTMSKQYSVHIYNNKQNYKSSLKLLGQKNFA